MEKVGLYPAPNVVQDELGTYLALRYYSAEKVLFGKKLP